MSLCLLTNLILIILFLLMSLLLIILLLRINLILIRLLRIISLLRIITRLLIILLLFFDSHFDHLSSSGDLSNSSGGSPLVRSTNCSSSRLIAHPGDSPSFVDSSALHSFELGPGLTTSAGSNDSANLAFLAFFAELVESVSFSHGDASSSAEFTTLVLALDSHCLGFCSSTSSSFSGSSSSSCEELSSSDFKLFFEFSCVLELHSGGGSLCLGHN